MRTFVRRYIAMPYTLSAGLFWYSLALVLGVLLGWLLRSSSAARQISRARRQERSAMHDEIESLRSQTASEQELRLERNRLRHDLEVLRGQLDDRGASQDLGESGPSVVRQWDEGDRDDRRIDLDEGARLLGRRLRTDDLQVVSGIGPVIEGLPNGVGIVEWGDLAASDVGHLVSTLADAGSRFARHDPSSWPAQAACLAAGDWSSFLSLVDDSRGVG